MGAEIMNKFLKVIGIGGNNSEAYDNEYDEAYDNDYTEEIEDDEEESNFNNQNQARVRNARASIKEVESAGNSQTRVISVNNGIT